MLSDLYFQLNNIFSGLFDWYNFKQLYIIFTIDVVGAVFYEFITQLSIILDLLKFSLWIQYNLADGYFMNY